MSSTPTREEIDPARAARIEAAQGVLAEAVAGIRDGDDWKRFLGFQSKLHAYSANNVLLLVTQHERLYQQGKVATPLPSYVASYRRWQELGRQVERGQTGLAIIAPMRGLRREAIDADGHARRLGKDDQLAAGETERTTPVMRGFTVEKVFSDAQTFGDPIPQPPLPKLLEGEAPQGLGEAVLRLVEERGYTVTTVPSAAQLQGANGRTTWANKTVQLRADIDDAAMVKTLIHEAAHVLLHNPDTNKDGASLPRGHQEVEAESVAYVVANVHGMPTDGYSFPYVAAWIDRDDHARVIAKTAQRVAACAKDIIAISPAEHGDGGRPATPTREIEQRQARQIEPIGISA